MQLLNFLNISFLKGRPCSIENLPLWLKTLSVVSWEFLLISVLAVGSVYWQLRDWIQRVTVGIRLLGCILSHSTHSLQLSQDNNTLQGAPSRKTSADAGRGRGNTHTWAQESHSSRNKGIPWNKGIPCSMGSDFYKKYMLFQEFPEWTQVVHCQRNLFVWVWWSGLLWWLSCNIIITLYY